MSMPNYNFDINILVFNDLSLSKRKMVKRFIIIRQFHRSKLHLMDRM